MRNFTISLILISLISACGLGQIERKIAGRKHNSLDYESLTRLPSQKLETLYGELKDTTNERGLYSYLVDCHLEGKLTEDSKVELRHLLRDNRENPHYWTILGGCALVSEQYSLTQYYYELAKTKLDRVPQRVKKEIRAIHLNNLAYIDLKLDHPEKAYQKWKKSHQILPSRTSLFNLSFLNLFFARIKKAERQFQVLLKKAPQDPDILLGLSVLEILKGNPQRSLTHFKKIPKSYLKRPDIAIYRAVALYEREELEKAYLQLTRHEYTTNSHLRDLADPLKKDIARELEEKRAEKEANGE